MQHVALYERALTLGPGMCSKEQFRSRELDLGSQRASALRATNARRLVRRIVTPCGCLDEVPEWPKIAYVKETLQKLFLVTFLWAKRCPWGA